MGCCQGPRSNNSSGIAKRVASALILVLSAPGFNSSSFGIAGNVEARRGPNSDDVSMACTHASYGMTPIAEMGLGADDRLKGLRESPRI